MSPNRRLEDEMSGDPPIDNVDPRDERLECLLIALQALSAPSGVAQASWEHTATVCKAARELIQDLAGAAELSTG